MIGVSPAYFLSRSGPDFGPDDIVSGLPFLAEAGYQAFQAEVFLESALPLWTKAATKAVTHSARNNGLSCSAFVAHFLGTVFSSGSDLRQGLPSDQAKAAITIACSCATSNAARLGNNPAVHQSGIGTSNQIFVVPLPTFAWLKTPMPGKQPDTASASRFRDIIGTLLALCNTAGLQLALELLPGNVLGGSDAFMSLVAEPGFSDLGLLLDTGHFWALGEKIQDLPRKLGSHIVATHLCDNNGIVNLSLCPGDGTIPFPETIKALGKAGYTGSLDIEIVCPRDDVEIEYRRAVTQFGHIAELAIAQPDRGRSAGHQTNQHPYKETL